MMKKLLKKYKEDEKCLKNSVSRRIQLNNGITRFFHFFEVGLRKRSPGRCRGGYSC